MKLLVLLLLVSMSSFASQKVDILWIVDNSGSMESIHSKIIRNSQKLFSQITETNLEWNMGVISTDKDDRPYLGFGGDFNSNTNNADTIFAMAISNLGTNGSANEYIFKSTLDKLSEYPHFVKSDKLIIIMITDEKEQSLQYGSQFKIGRLLLSLGRYYKDIHPIAVLEAGGVEGCSSHSNFNYIGSRFESFVNILEGELVSACKEDMDIFSAMRL